jgi:inner membrane protein
VHHFFLPQELKVSGKLNPEVRYRGIFDTVVYSSEIEMDAKFAVPESLADDGRLNFAKAELCLGLGDLKGIAGPVSAEIDGKAVEFNAGMPSRDLVPVGISTKIPEGLLSAASGGTAPAAKFAVSIKMDLNGSMEMNFLPFGKTTDVEVESAWSSPSFSGAYLPMRRDVKESGFSAEWKMLEMNRPYPQQFEGKAFNAADTAFGVKLMIPADIYQQSSRTAKYAALFIVFTFAALFVTEFLTGAKIHIVQYLMTGLAVVLFYSLLLAVSEHVSFGRAYFISAAAVVAMIGLYARGMLGKTVFSLALSAIISILYTYFYVILQMEDYALLTGNIGLFTVLGIMMFATRRINRGAQELAAAGS